MLLRSVVDSLRLVTADTAARPGFVRHARNRFNGVLLLFGAISGRVPGGTDRKTHKMMRLDLDAARKQWIEEAKTATERSKREQSDFLSYCNDAGLYADFHASRHLFITSLERAGIRPKVAQTLARHSDVRLTLQVYTHVELHDQTAAIESLPGPPGSDQRSTRRTAG